VTADLSPSKAPPRAGLSLAAIAIGTVAVNIGIDLVLPAVPTLPDVLGGTTATAQFILAGFAGGAACGLLFFGWLADHFDRRLIFIGALGAFALLSFAAAVAPNMNTLIALRVLQGATASGPGVVMAGMVHSLYDEARSVRAMGFLGSIQSLAPALAPIAGAWLTLSFGWASTFVTMGVVAGLTFLVIVLAPSLLPAGRSGAGPEKGTYRELLASPAYLRQALGYALVLGGLLVFVFAAPAVIVKTMSGTIADFVILQVVGIATFIVSANVSGNLATRFGAERIIFVGTILALTSGLGFLVYALAGGNSPTWLIPIWIPMNIGMGLRGPASYVGAVKAAGTNDARASALILLFLTLIMAVGTAIVAPFLEHGLVVVAIAVVVIIVPALILLLAIPAPKPALQS
jgi:MFS family permease